ncbi:Phage holin, partial [Dysosmobacter welbionis]
SIPGGTRQDPGIHRHPRLPAGPAHRGGPGGAHSTRNSAICPRTFGVHTAVTAMVSPYSTFSTLASRYSWSSRP